MMKRMMAALSVALLGAGAALAPVPAEAQGRAEMHERDRGERGERARGDRRGEWRENRRGDRRGDRDEWRDDRRDDRDEWRDDRRDERRAYRDGRRDGRDAERRRDRHEDRRIYRDGYRDGRHVERRYDYYDDRRSYRDGYRDGRRYHAPRYSWNPRQHNGYFLRDRWFWGTPPSHYYNDPYWRPGYRALQRGRPLPHGYRVVRVYDYHRYGLYHPGRDRYWARDDRGVYFLIGLATGIILDEVVRGY